MKAKKPEKSVCVNSSGNRRNKLHDSYTRHSRLQKLNSEDERIILLEQKPHEICKWLILFINLLHWINEINILFSFHY